jgi:hypothetical protein
MHEFYKIDGTSNICDRELQGREYNDPDFYPSFREDYTRLKILLQTNVINSIPTVILRIFDGEFYFLEGQKVGNVGSRHISRNITQNDIDTFKQGFLNADYVSTQIYEDQLEKYHRLFPYRKIDFPMELIYSLVANKWLFETFKEQGIGIIGGSEKIRVIKELMKHKEYREYLRMDDYDFTDYIEVPERFSCDDPKHIEEKIGEQLIKSKSKLFIFGIGIGKLAVAHTFKKYSPSVFLDVGCGISALAGTTSIERPYFGSWINYRLKDYDYRGVDPIDYRDTQGKNEKLI